MTLLQGDACHCPAPAADWRRRLLQCGNAVAHLHRCMYGLSYAEQDRRQPVPLLAMANPVSYRPAIVAGIVIGNSRQDCNYHTAKLPAD